MNKSLLTWMCAAGISANAVAQEHHAHPHDGFGQPGDLTRVSRTVDITMSDAMRFTPSIIPVKPEETIRFFVTNAGKLKHEMVLGSAHELRAHAALMKRFPDMEHSDPNHLRVDPGKSGELIWKVPAAGAIYFACLQPGHWDAGMRGKIVVKTAMNDHRPIH